ncbi:hypothetical protein BX666DRAFT_1911422 [Dichotomocladium elegans]|nr:hypothetical protein BX666DRAFT_1911422 [Dichotomocladium elegans]
MRFILLAVSAAVLVAVQSQPIIETRPEPSKSASVSGQASVSGSSGIYRAFTAPSASKGYHNGGYFDFGEASSMTSIPAMSVSASASAHGMAAAAASAFPVVVISGSAHPSAATPSASPRSSSPASASSVHHHSRASRSASATHHPVSSHRASSAMNRSVSPGAHPPSASAFVAVYNN